MFKQITIIVLLLVFPYSIVKSQESLLSHENPMGKTWVVFVENTNYSTFASLGGAEKDVNLMMSAFANYQIDNIVYKKDLTKQDMEVFFKKELNTLVDANSVNSLLIWYAGHGKMVNDVSYWIPVDAQRDNEFTYYNIDSLRNCIQASMADLAHTLIITDACESGPSFYQAMRESTLPARTCDDWKATQFKSSQVFSSAGYELAEDDSQFTRTFANVLNSSNNTCVSIEEIVAKVSMAVTENNQKKPKFGKIEGLYDENGTFFFMSR